MRHEPRAATADELARPRQSVTAALGALALEAGMRVLDAGCGVGPHLGLFTDRVASPAYLLADPDSFQARTCSLAVGTAP